MQSVDSISYYFVSKYYKKTKTKTTLADGNEDAGGDKPKRTKLSVSIWYATKTCGNKIQIMIKKTLQVPQKRLASLNVQTSLTFRELFAIDSFRAYLFLPLYDTKTCKSNVVL